MKKTGLLLGLVVALAGCASLGTKLSDNERLEIHRAHAGEPVRSFHNFGNLYNWTPLGDSALTVWTRRNQAYLLELDGHCPNLDYARAISFSGQGGTVFAGMDNVVVLDREPFNIPCRIKQIRPLDTKAVESDERAARDQARRSEPQSPVGGT
ncbi:MAG TPA: DUF6491 family protein [Lysobacter sp.]|nr:DUF6491 family protein [Lysobacter sp.]